MRKAAISARVRNTVARESRRSGSWRHRNRVDVIVWSPVDVGGTDDPAVGRAPSRSRQVFAARAYTRGDGSEALSGPPRHGRREQRRNSLRDVPGLGRRDSGAARCGALRPGRDASVNVWAGDRSRGPARPAVRRGVGHRSSSGGGSRPPQRPVRTTRWLCERSPGRCALGKWSSSRTTRARSPVDKITV